MDYTILHALNVLVREHPLLADSARLLATWVVPVVVAATVLPWLASGSGVDARKRATAGALASAALAMAVNQLIIQFWQRPRPYVAHPAGILPLAGISHDPSFPSDHTAAAFAIAVAALIAYRRAGRVLLVLACAVAASRVLAGAHYPADVIGGAIVGGTSGLVVMRLAWLWTPLVGQVARVTDPARLRLAALPPVSTVIGDARIRTRIVLVLGLAIGVRFGIAMDGHLLDEMPLLLLAGWAACVAWAVGLARGDRAGHLRLGT